MPENLNGRDRRKVAEIIRNAQRDDGTPRTTQQSIPFDRMFQDGICRIGKDYYTKTIQFQDINYLLAQQDDQKHSPLSQGVRPINLEKHSVRIFG